MGSAGRVWVTRAQPGASATAERLVALGRNPLIAPLLDVRALPVSPDLDGVTALAFTSANAVRAYADLIADRTPPAYAVGAATARALAKAGFRIAGTGTGGVEALARLIIGHRAPPAAGTVLHPSALEPAGDLVGVLSAAGLKTEQLAVYETVRVSLPSAEAVDALRRGQVAAVLLHSPKAARVLADVAAAHGLARALRDVRALALSPACLTPVADLGFAGRAAAERPCECALLSLL